MELLVYWLVWRFCERSMKTTIRVKETLGWSTGPSKPSTMLLSVGLSLIVKKELVSLSSPSLQPCGLVPCLWKPHGTARRSHQALMAIGTPLKKNSNVLASWVTIPHRTRPSLSQHISSFISSKVLYWRMRDAKLGLSLADKLTDGLKWSSRAGKVMLVQHLWRQERTLS